MTRWFLIVAMLLLVVLTGCTPRIYGVPEKQWDTMSEQERITAMEAYKSQQETYRQQQAEKARLKELEKKAQLAREMEEARLRQQRIDAIYRGEGRYGDLLHVRLERGEIKIHGSYRPYHTVAFKIAAGETKEVEMVDRKHGRKVSMLASYDGSSLVLDKFSNSNYSGAARLLYEDTWQSGKSYDHLATDGPRKCKGVVATVKIVGQPPNTHRPDPGDHAIGQPSNIKVTFRKGDLKIKNRNCPLYPKTVFLNEGQVSNVNLGCQRGKLKVRLSYIDGELFIDHASGRGNRITHLKSAPGWKRGQSYIIPDTENHRIKDLELYIKSSQRPTR